ncbi:FAD-dependent oxidoreductase, partial [Streptomyces sp. SID14478]|uniref:FAD-dependent oxidoreductase n=1 Tax=Streptomyces sp. SID14478 TaxID=2706073 RepID=UPI0013DB9B68
GAETASTCVALGHDVTVVEAAPLPLLPQLGPELAAVCAQLQRNGGARLLTGVGVANLHGAPGAALADRVGDAPADGPRVTGVRLTDGRLLPADIVVVGIGAVPNTAWLSGSTVAVRDGVLCDDGCVTSLPQAVAVGDVARVGGARAEHWTSATSQPRVAVRNLLAGRAVEAARPLPYFWSDQFGSRIQFAGRRREGDLVRFVEGTPDEGRFLAQYERDGVATAVLAVDMPRPFTKVRRELARVEREVLSALALVPS